MKDAITFVSCSRTSHKFNIHVIKFYPSQSVITNYLIKLTENEMLKIEGNLLIDSL